MEEFSFLYNVKQTNVKDKKGKPQIIAFMSFLAATLRSMSYFETLNIGSGQDSRLVNYK